MAILAMLPANCICIGSFSSLTMGTAKTIIITIIRTQVRAIKLRKVMYLHRRTPLTEESTIDVAFRRPQGRLVQGVVEREERVGMAIITMGGSRQIK
jgi:hypothetical protein